MNNIKVENNKYNRYIQISLTNQWWKYVAIYYGKGWKGDHYTGILQCFKSGIDGFYYNTDYYKFFNI